MILVLNNHDNSLKAQYASTEDVAKFFQPRSGYQNFSYYNTNDNTWIGWREIQRVASGV